MSAPSRGNRLTPTLPVVCSGMLIDDDRLVQAIDDALGAERDLVVGLDVAEHDHEFVAAHADHDVAVAHAGAQPARDFLQELVAGLMAAGVVDVLEAVEVQEHDAEHLIRRARLVDGLRQERGQIMTIRQTRQLIVVRHAIEPLLIVDELLLGLAAHRHVMGDVGKALAAVGLEPIAADLHVDLRAALAAQLQIERRLRVGVLQPRQHALRLMRRRRRKCR